MRISSTMLLVLLAIAGCGRSEPREQKQTVGHNYEVRAGGSVGKGHGDEFSAQVGGNSVELKAGKFTANGKSYGPVVDGANILVDDEGKVFIDGKQRAAE